MALFSGNNVSTFRYRLEILRFRRIASLGSVSANGTPSLCSIRAHTRRTRVAFMGRPSPDVQNKARKAVLCRVRRCAVCK